MTPASIPGVSPVSAFSAVEYKNAAEAAAFVAALSRVLASPVGAKYLATDAPVEVLANTSPRGVTVFLSERAAAAAAAAFAPGPDSTPVDRSAIPETAMTIVASPHITALGRDDVLRRFSQSSGA